MEKLTESFMKKNLNEVFKKFVDDNLKGYEFVYITSDLRGFIKEFNIKDIDNLCLFFINYLIKKKLTVLVPAYSYTSKNNFYVEKTKSNLSYLTKWSLKQKNSFRTYHPIFSFAVIGKDHKKFLKNGKSAFGNNSVWEKLLKEKTSLLHLGRPFSWGNTIIHFVEFKEKAKYRFNKTFKTKVFKNNKCIGTNFSAFVQKKKFNGKSIDTNTKKIGNLIKKQNFYKEVGKNSNLTNITHLDFKKTFEFMCKKYKKDRKIFIDYK